jgi:hypothetical protein
MYLFWLIISTCLNSPTFMIHRFTITGGIIEWHDPTTFPSQSMQIRMWFSWSCVIHPLFHSDRGGMLGFKVVSNVPHVFHIVNDGAVITNV